MKRDDEKSPNLIVGMSSCKRRSSNDECLFFKRTKTHKDEIPDLVKVYSQGPVGENFTNQKELDIILASGDYPHYELALHRNQDDHLYVSLVELQECIQGACSLYQLDFEDMDLFNGVRKRKVNSMQVADNQVLIVSNELEAPFFVIYEEKERNSIRSYFQMILVKSNSALDEAIELATRIIKTDRYCKIIFDFNRQDCTVNDVQIEFSTQKLYIVGAQLPEDVHGFFNELESIDSFAINYDLILLAERLSKSPSSPGRRRFVLFLAMTILHESTHWKHYLYRSELGTIKEPIDPIHQIKPEAGSCFEKYFMGGVLDLSYDRKGGVGDVILKIVPRKHCALVISSPQAAEATREITAGQVPSLFASVQTTPVLKRRDKSNVEEANVEEANVEKVEIVLDEEDEDSADGPSTSTGRPSIKLKVSVINRAHRPIYLPDSMSLSHFNLKGYEIDEHGTVIKELRSRFKCSKLRLLELCEGMTRIAPNESMTLKSHNDLNFYFDIEWSKIYHFDISFQANMCHNDYTYHYESETCSYQACTSDLGHASSQSRIEFKNPIIKFVVK